MAVTAPKALAKYIARKGSIAVNGVSLTVNEVNGTAFVVNLIPHTLKATNLGSLREGDRVNLEVDMVARYLERLKSVTSDR
jgi:riboflavin synthase